MQPILPPPEFDPALDPFLALNQGAFEQLVTFVDFAGERFTLGFISVNFAKDRDHLIHVLQQHPRCQEIQFDVVHLPNPELRFLRDALLEELPGRPLQPGRKRIVVLTGLEYAIGMVGNYPMVLQDLNYVRDAFTTSVPHPLLIYLPDSALTRLARYAPDFWAWRRGVFEFKSLEATIQTAYEAIFESDQLSGNLDWEKQREYIDSLERLLMENNTSAQMSQRVNILSELGKLYREVAELHKAETVLSELLVLTEAKEEKFKRVRASSLRELAKICAQSGELNKALKLYEKFLQQVDSLKDLKEVDVVSTLSDVAGLVAQQGDFTRALELLQQSLVIQERIDDIYGEAVTLSAMADIATQKGDFERALDLWRKSLAIQNSTNNLQGKTSTLNNIASVIASQGNFEGAYDLWQQSLRILEQIGDMQGKAAVLNNLAGLIVEQGDIDRGLDLWQQSLEIKERIGDVKSKAATLGNMAQVIANQGDVERALDLWQRSLEIKERIGDVKGKAATLNNMALVIADQGDIERALALWQQSLEISERIGDVKGKAATLNNMALVIADQGDIERALDLWQRSLEIQERIGEVKGKATTLANMATNVYRQGDSERAAELLKQSAQALGQMRAYGDLVTVLNNLNAITDKSNLIYLAQAVWLCIKIQAPLQETLSILKDLYNVVPQADELEALLAAFALFLCAQRGQGHPQLAQLQEQAWKMMAGAAGAQGITTQDAVDDWFTQQQLNDSAVFLPHLNQRLEVLIDNQWAFDPSPLQ